jgi:hypothetical protein
MLKPIALALMLVVGLVLIIACANVASMLLRARRGVRRKSASASRSARAGGGGAAVARQAS